MDIAERGSKNVERESKLYNPESSLYNKDLAPVPPEKRTWGIYNYASLWVAMSVCIPTYMLASGLIAGGMSWKQAIGTILLGNIIVLIPMILNAHAGAKYGIPFPVLVRASFGSARSERARRIACAGGLRMVRNSILDRRPSHVFDAASVVASGRFERVDPVGSASICFGC